jgi:hypothetical protein
MLTLLRRAVAAVTFALTFAAAPFAAAEGLDQPTDEVLLTVSGDIAVTNGDGVARFDRAMLEALDPVTFTTSTIWTDGAQEFTGVPLHVLLDALNIDDARLSATAINDYAVEIPTSDAVEGGPIIAYLNNGSAMSVRDKGPLWIVYPYDSNDAYQTETIYSRSIWQLDRIVVVE